MSRISKKDMERALTLAAEIFDTKTRPVLMPGEAILGIEAIARSAACPGRRFLNIVTGPYGAQFGDWLRDSGAEVEDLVTGYDQVIGAAAVEKTVREAEEAGRPFCCLAYVHTEAVTGGVNPVEEIQKIAKAHGLITILDSVSAIGADEFHMDAWNVDIVSMGLQKALGGPNGISFLGISENGMKFLKESRNAVHHSILSVIDTYAEELDHVPETLSWLEFDSGLKALENVAVKGMQELRERHLKAAEEIREGAKRLEYRLWQREEKGCSDLNTTVVLPDTPAAHAFSGKGIVQEGNGSLRGKLLRINHYGTDCTPEKVQEALRTLEELASSPESYTYSGVHLNGEKGTFDVQISGGKIVKVTESHLDTGRYLSAGLIDMHLHPDWTDFNPREIPFTEEEKIRRIADYLGRMYRLGFCYVRDAGGMRQEEWLKVQAFAEKQGLKIAAVVPNGGMIDGDNYTDETFIKDVLEGPETWVKIFATGGIGAPSERVLEPVMPEAAFKSLVKRLHTAGKKVMVHTWGGDSLDWSIEAGVDSVEHCIHMTRDQAGKLSAAGIPLCGTTYVYRQIADPENPIKAAPGLIERAAKAAAAHRNSVRYAAEAGVTIINGTDLWSDTDLAGWELSELFSMQDYGISREQAFVAACGEAYAVLFKDEKDRPDGKIETGQPADLILFSSDPLKAESPEELAGMILNR